jgi:hypothetical protein
MATARFPHVLQPYDIARMRAEGRCVIAVAREHVVVRADLHHLANGAMFMEALNAEWRRGPRCAKVVGINNRGNAYYVEIGTEAIARGRALAERIDVPEQPAAPRLRKKRTGRILPGWAARIAWRKIEPLGLAKEEKV